MQKTEEFVTKLLEEKGINPDSEIKAELVADMKKRLEDQVNRACIEALSEDKAKELASLIDKPDFTAEKMAEFMQNSGVDMLKIATEIMQRFRELYLGEEA